MSWQPPTGPPDSGAPDRSGPRPPIPPPGWYVDAAGALRWWDGATWGQQAPSAPHPPGAQPAVGGAPPSSSSAMIAHLLGLFTGVLGPLILFLVTDKRDSFTRDQAAEALNFQITYVLAAAAGVPLIIVSLLISPILMLLVLFVYFPVLLIADWTLSIMAAVSANRGEWHRYPVNIRMVSP